MMLPKYVTAFNDRHGKRRYRFRKAGVSKMLPDPRTDESAFWAAYSAALSDKPTPMRRFKDRSIAHAANLYFQSVAYRDMKPQSQQHRTRWINAIIERYGDQPCAAFRRRHIIKAMQDAGETPTAQHTTHRAFALLFRVAIEQDWIQSSPTVGVRKPKLGDGAKTWTLAQISAFRLKFPLGTEHRKAFELFLATGQRLSDVCKMHVNDIEGDVIHVVQDKTGADLWLPLTAAALEAIDAAPPIGGWLVGTRNGTKRSAPAMGNWINKAIHSAVGEGMSAHGLRKTVSKMLADNQATDAEIMAITGHATRAEVTRYTRSANQRLLAKSGANKMGKVSNPIVKPAP